MEQRAAAACEGFKKNDGGAFRVTWNRSRTWGRCPRIVYRGEKAAYAGGCGYDKLSAVLVSFLKWLALDGEYLGGSASGVEVVRENLEAFGWDLVHEYNGDSKDGFVLRCK
jgi:hypothetical protein